MEMVGVGIHSLVVRVVVVATLMVSLAGLAVRDDGGRRTSVGHVLCRRAQRRSQYLNLTTDDQEGETHEKSDRADPRERVEVELSDETGDVAVSEESREHSDGEL